MHTLSTKLQFDDLAGAPDAIVLLKHSTTCPVSAAALDEIDALRQREPAVEVYMVDVNAQRDVSNYIADRLAIEHDSPQAIVLVRGNPVWHAEHFGISADQIASQLVAARP